MEKISSHGKKDKLESKTKKSSAWPAVFPEVDIWAVVK